MPPGKKDADSLKNPLPSMLDDTNKPLDPPINPASPPFVAPATPKMDSVVKNQRNRVKPLLEGINSPVGGFKAPDSVSLPSMAGNESLTEAENKLISETADFKAPESMLMPKFAAEGASKKRHRV